MSRPTTTPAPPYELFYDAGGAFIGLREHQTTHSPAGLASLASELRQALAERDGLKLALATVTEHADAARTERVEAEASKTISALRAENTTLSEVIAGGVVSLVTARALARRWKQAAGRYRGLYRSLGGADATSMAVRLSEATWQLQAANARAERLAAERRAAQQREAALAVLVETLREAMERARLHCHTDLSGEAADVLEVALAATSAAAAQAQGAALLAAARAVLWWYDSKAGDEFAKAMEAMDRAADALRAVGLAAGERE